MTDSARRPDTRDASRPLDVAQILDEEYRALYEAEGRGAPAAPLPGWLLSETQIVTPTGLMARLRGTSVVARFFSQRLPETTRDALEKGDVQMADVVDGLNRLLREPTLLYDKTRLPDVRLDRDLQALTARPLAGEDLVRVNRLLLEHAFPTEIIRIYDVRLRAIHQRIHARGKDGPPRTALCISGGGIRSATFGLGVLQGLAQHELLDRFDYLSTVSGGGYVGAWLTSWIHRHRDGTLGVMHELANARPRSPVTPEPGPIHHLREYSNYLSPRLGMLSADAWTLLGIYLRNLVLNWTVLVPLLLSVLAVPRLVLALMLLDPTEPWRIAILGVGFVLLVMTVAYVTVFRPSFEEHRVRLPSWLLGRGTQGWFLLLCLAPLLLSAVLLTTYWSWHSNAPRGNDARVIVVLCALGAGLHVVTWAVASSLLRRLDLRELGVSAATGLVAGGIAGLVATKVLPDAHVWQYAEYYVVLALPLFIGAFLLAATVFVGVVSQFTTDEDREWWARFGAWALIAMVGWMIVATTVILGPPALLSSWKRVVPSLTIGTVSAFVAVQLGKSGKTAGAGPKAGATGTSMLMNHAATVAAPVALLVIAAALSWVTTAAIVAIDANSRIPILHTCRNWPVVEPPWPALPSPAGHSDVLHCAPLWFIAVAIAALVAVAFAASWRIDVNKFSLHAMYRARLIRAYLGASRLRRMPNPFTGFDPLDDLQMHQMRDEAFNPGSFREPVALVTRLKSPPPGDDVSRTLRQHLSSESQAMLESHVAGTEPSSTLAQRLIDDLNWIIDTVRLQDDPAFQGLAAKTVEPLEDGLGLARRNRALLEAAYPDEIRHSPPPPRKPLHVLNMALNVVGGHNLAWQERKAETFTVTELHAGSYHLGYRRSYDYGGERPRGLTLGTAVAISGAAASPNMGYHSSPLVTFLMAMFNARLGWWLGNPGPHGYNTFWLATPRVSILPMLREALGMTDDNDGYVYLSDGGHFENLGLFEMVLRRCHLIVVSDAGCDPGCSFEDLGNAIRKVRVDLGVPITIDQRLRIRARTIDGRSVEPDDAASFAVGTIKYSVVDAGGVDGHLIYLKPCFYGNEPVDVLNYALAHVAFPHESTADQFFSESQFESYRQLGVHTVTTILAQSRPS